MSRKILVVDDEKDVRLYLGRLLEKAGYEVVSAEDGREALTVARQELPAVVLLDLQMPKGTGTDFYRQLRKDKDLAETPVIVISGLAGRDLAVKDAVAVYDKPIDPDELLAAVEKALGD